MRKNYFKSLCKKTWSDSVKINFIEGKYYNCTIFSKNAITAFDEDNSKYNFHNNTFYQIFYTNQELRKTKLNNIRNESKVQT